MPGRSTPRATPAWLRCPAGAAIRAGNVFQGLSTGTRDAGQAGGRGGGLMIGAAKQK